MYKDDNIIGGCSDSLLRIIAEGRGNSCPVCERSSAQDKGSCREDCRGTDGWGLKAHPLASVYAPLQDFDNLYDANTALKQGTVFAELDLPFMGERRVRKGGNCRG